MLHVNFHVRYVKSAPCGSNQVTKSGRVQGEAELLLPDVLGQNASCQITEQFSEPLQHGSRKSQRVRCCKITEKGSRLLGGSTHLNNHGGEAYIRDSSKEVKKTFYRTRGRWVGGTRVMDIEQYLNNRPLMYIYTENELGE